MSTKHGDLHMGGVVDPRTGERTGPPVIQLEKNDIAAVEVGLVWVPSGQ